MGPCSPHFRPGGNSPDTLIPLACSLRYHLGLKTPNDDNCFINVDGQMYSWRDGEAMLFDETYIHYVENQTDKPRLILMCDVERPMGVLGKIVNFFYKGLTRLTVVPNTKEDDQGFVNKTFAGLAPLNKKLQGLKESNRPLYLLIKWSINLFLLLVLIAIFAGIFKLLALLIS